MPTSAPNTFSSDSSKKPISRPCAVIETFGIDANKIRAEIDKLVTRGREPVGLKTPPLTPRARHAIDHAHNETRLMGRIIASVPSHLFLGLMNEPSGVACQVLLNLGINRQDLTKEVFKVRLAQMKIVERIVAASTGQHITAKTQNARGLAAHLSSDLTTRSWRRPNNPTAALEAAAGGWANPTELARELEDRPAPITSESVVSSSADLRGAHTESARPLCRATGRAIPSTFSPSYFRRCARRVSILRYGWIARHKGRSSVC